MPMVLQRDFGRCACGIYIFRDQNELRILHVIVPGQCIPNELSEVRVLGRPTIEPKGVRAVLKLTVLVLHLTVLLYPHFYERIPISEKMMIFIRGSNASPTQWQQRLYEAKQCIDYDYSNRIIFQMYDHLNVVSDHPHIPEEAFLLLPNRVSDLHTKDDFRVGYGKKVRRLLHQGWAVDTFTPFQLQKLKELEDYLKEKKIILDARWDKSWRLRFLISTGFNLKKCVADMEIFIQYQHSVSNLTLSKNVAKHLKDGVFYIAGRDCKYRPILVFDVDKIIKSGMSEDQCIETQTYFFEYVMRNFLIPGQVENWVAIIDVAEIGLFSLINSMKKSFTFLADTYRSRMCVCYVVRIPTSISFLWTVVKRFLDEDTVIKINFFDDQKVEPLLEYCSPSQLEKKFGGTLENIAEGHFWPPREVSKQYKCQKEPVKLLTKEEYTKYYRNNIFYNTKFHEENIIPQGSNERRDNVNLQTLKRIEKEFKLDLEMNRQDHLDYRTQIKPFSDLKPPLNYHQLLLKHSSTPELITQK